MSTLTPLRIAPSITLLVILFFCALGLRAEDKAPPVPLPAGEPVELFTQATVVRKLALDALLQSATKPNDAAQLRKTAADKFAEALQKFAAAGDAFAAAVRLPNGAANLDWVLRSRCEQADVLLRLEKNADAVVLVQTLIEGKAFASSSLRPMALYQLGCAHFASKAYLRAGRALIQLAPFDQEFGLHARYMLSRIHHLSGEFPEAVAGYKALFADYDVRKKIAEEALKNPGALKPDERARHEALVKAAPEYVARAQFYSALILAEAGEFGEALAGFTPFATQNTKHPLIDEAKLRQGYCFVQVKNFPEAIKVLQPLAEHPQVGDRATWWLARATMGAADPANPKAVEAAGKQAIVLLGKAADKCNVLGASDSDAKARRGDILLELGDIQLLAHANKDAVATYEKVIAEFSESERAEEALQRQATALHLDGLYKESDALCEKFEKAYPKSILLSEVWFRAAENACLAAMAAASDPKANENKAVWEKGFDESISRYQRLLEKFPEFSYVNLARYGLGSAQYRRGRYVDAVTTLSAILDVDRSGDLAHVNSVIADCLIRQFPSETDDALQSAQLMDRAEQAARLLDKYAATQGKTPEAADAFLKAAQCYQRMGEIVVVPAERQILLARARQIYEKVMGEFLNSPSMPSAVLERARVIALQGDVNGAINECNRFNSDPLKQSPLAPLALVRQSAWMRTQNRPNDALNVMLECRKRYEEKLLKDPMRSEWVSQIQYEHALALKDLRKLPEARGMFNELAKKGDLKARWRSAQCQREEGVLALANARDVQKKSGAKPEEVAAATLKIEETLNSLRGLAESLKADVAKREPNAPIADAQLWMLYETAWCHRTLADAEIESVRQMTGGKAVAKIIDNLKKAAPTQPAPVLALPDIPLSDIPPQPSEKAAQDAYASLLTLSPTSSVAARARLESAELQAQRGQIDAALELLVAGLEESPNAEMAERLHVNLAACLLAKGEVKLALVQTQAVLKNPASGQFGEATFVTGQCYIQSKDWPNAIAQLSVFRDKDPFRNRNGLAERGLVQLGFAFTQAQRWDESRQAYEILVQRFPQSPFVHEARFEIATLWQRANQFDNAYNTFIEITRRSAGEIAAQAQLQMGKCRMAQKRFPDALKEWMTVASIYDYPEINAEALINAADAQVELKKPAEATALLQRVIKEFATTKAAEAAKKRVPGTK